MPHAFTLESPSLLSRPTEGLPTGGSAGAREHTGMRDDCTGWGRHTRVRLQKAVEIGSVELEPLVGAAALMDSKIKEFNAIISISITTCTTEQRRT